MRPVSDEYSITQGFASLATAGVVGDLNGTQVQVLVALYGNYQPDGHAGADIGCPVGTPVRAVRSGTVVLCDWDVNLPGDDSWGPSGYFQRFAFYKAFGGRLLVIQYAVDDHDVYAHLSDWKVSNGQFVNEGDLIALSGDSSGGRDGALGPHLHTERIIDPAYSTGNGEIYGRIDPTPLWGGIAAQGTITQEADVLTDEDKVWLGEKLYAVLEDPNVLEKLRTGIINDASLVNIQGTVLPTLNGHAQNLWNGVQAVPAAVLNQTFKLADGTVTNLAGILAAINAKPLAGGTVTNVAADPQAVVRALAAQLNK